MRYTKFRVQNFKGIRDATIEFDPYGAARVYSLVGLNESGKTTILEAIHSFSPDADTQIVVGSVSTVDEQRRQRVPKDKLSDFTGDVVVTATLRLDEGDIEKISRHCSEAGFSIDENLIPSEFQYQKYQRYRNGDYIGSFRSCSISLKVKTGRQKNFRDPTPSDEKVMFLDIIESLFPAIAYFPTFVFDFPPKIYLSERRISKVNDFYKRLFQDILDFDGRGNNIKTHIIDRIGKPEYKVEFVSFFPVFTRSNDGEKIKQVIDRAARSVTGVIFNKWNEIFGEDVSGKEVAIEFGLEEAPDVLKEGGKKEKSTNHDIYIEFFVKDGIKRFPIKDRSLGFRWFFSFLLFTQFRAARDDERPIIFLLDEPASNLHAAAQQKLIDSFPEIARDPHSLVYSTHSHYMINPNWLEQCYIIKNDPADQHESIVEQASVEDDAYDIQAVPYKRFVENHPGKTSYFQPIIDRLDVVPSRFDIDKTAAILEGKSDYYILEYFSKIHFKSKVAMIPGLGSGSLDALIGIHRGWGLPVRVMLDSDKAGIKEKERYQDTYSLSEDEIFLLGDLSEGLKDIEDILSDVDRELISKKIAAGGKVSKKHILLFFQTSLASQEKVKFSKETENRARSVIGGLEARLK